jgi:uncharacterized protein YjbJ (UPF0337 family)
VRLAWRFAVPTKPTRVAIVLTLGRPSRNPQEGSMNDKTDRVEGKLKKGAGTLSGDDELKQEGQAQDTKGKAKQGVENLKDAGKKALGRD